MFPHTANCARAASSKSRTSAKSRRKPLEKSSRNLPRQKQRNPKPHPCRLKRPNRQLRQNRQENRHPYLPKQKCRLRQNTGPKPRQCRLKRPNRQENRHPHLPKQKCRLRQNTGPKPRPCRLKHPNRLPNPHLKKLPLPQPPQNLPEKLPQNPLPNPPAKLRPNPLPNLPDRQPPKKKKPKADCLTVCSAVRTPCCLPAEARH